MKTILLRFILAVGALVAFTGILVAQAAGALPEAGTLVTPLPKSTAEYWMLGIAALTPLIVGGIYKLAPKLPKLVLPASTPIVGILLGLGVNALASANLGWIDMAQAGALAVFVREVWTNAVTKQLASAAGSPPANSPALGG